MVAQVAGDHRGRVDHQARRRDPRLRADPVATSSARRMPTSSSTTGSTSSAGSSSSSTAPTCRTSSLSEGVEPIPIADETRYAGKPNPHAWMSAANVQIYVENIRDAFDRARPRARPTSRRTRERYSAELQQVHDELVSASSRRCPPQRRALVTLRGGVLLPGARRRPHRAVPLAGQRRAAGHAAADRRRPSSSSASSGVPAVFCESTVSDKAEQQVARERARRFGGMLYVDSLSRGRRARARRTSTCCGTTRTRSSPALTGRRVVATDRTSARHRGRRRARAATATRSRSTTSTSPSRPGIVHGLIGMNGSGKSTLFKAIMGIVRPDAGTRRAVRRLAPSRRAAAGRVAYVPQSEDVDWAFPVSRARRRDDGPLRPDGLAPARERRTTAARSTRRSSASSSPTCADRQIGELSGGQRKRAFVARGLAQGAELLLLDEPFAGVDKRSEATITELLRDLADDGGTIARLHPRPGRVPALCDDASRS